MDSLRQNHVQVALVIGTALGGALMHYWGQGWRRRREGGERLWGDAFPALAVAKDGPVSSVSGCLHSAAAVMPSCLSSYRSRRGTRETGMEMTYHYLDESFFIPHDRLAIILKRFQEELAKGLAKQGSTMAMIPSYVTNIPDGHETGTYLAVDLGGTNFRVCQVTLAGHGKSKMIQRKFHLTDTVKRSDGKALFDFIAEAVRSLLEDSAKEAANDPAAKVDFSQTYNLGFTFSFPVDQTAINSGVLLKWTKGFDSAGVVNRDVVELLQEAFKRKVC